MKYVIIGGDERAPYLCRRLIASGDEAVCFALDNTAICETLSGDVFVLPMPIERNGYLNAPLSAEKYSLEEIFSLLPKGALVCGGKVGEKAMAKANVRGLRLYDYMDFPALTVGNAAITAEAATEILMTAAPGCLSEQKVLIIGCGRIGKLLAFKLRALGTDVTLLSGDPEKAALLHALGFKTAHGEDDLSDYSAVVNTAAATVLTEGQQRSLKSECVVLELASKSGFDEKLVSHCRLISAPGLPAKYAPSSSAALVFDAVKTIVKEHYHE